MSGNKIVKRPLPFLGLASAYLGLALVMTWPLARYFSSYAAAASEDGAMSVWSLWWMKYSLIGLGQNPLNCTYLFYPDGLNLVFTTFPKALAALSIPLQYVLGLTAAYNLVFLLTFVGTGVATYYLVLHFTGDRLSSFLAGAFFAFCPYRWGQQSHLWFLSTMMIPVFLLMIVKGKEALDGREPRAWIFFVLAGLALAVQTYDTEHYTISLLLISGVYLIFNLVFARGRAALKNCGFLALGLAVAAAISFLLYLPLLIAANREIDRNGDYVTFPIREIWPGADLLTFFVPDSTSWFWGEAFRPVLENVAGTETHFLGWTVTALALVGLWRYRKERQVWFWAAAGVLFALLALGPYLVINGEMKQIPGPFLLLQKIPLLNSTRVPVRFSLFTTLSLSVLAGYGIDSIARALRRLKGKRLALPALAAVILILMFVEDRPIIPLVSTKAPAVYEEIARTEAPGSLIAVPLGWEATPQGGGDEMTFVQLYQPVHSKPMPGGMAGRAPQEKVLRRTYTPVLDYLAEPKRFAPTALDKDAAVIDRVMNDYGIAFIVIHKNYPDSYYKDRFLSQYVLTDEKTLLELDAYITAFLKMEKISETDEYVAYRRN